MNKLIVIVISISIFHLNGFAQEEFEFNNEFLSETNYLQETNTTNAVKIVFSGSKEFLKNLKLKKIKNPQKTIENTHTKIAYKTGISNNDVFPIEIEYIETWKSDSTDLLKNGDKLFGTIGPNSLIKLNDISNTSIQEDEKQLLIYVLEYGFSIELFKSEKMKIGDTFTTKSPISFPIAGTQFDIIIESIYKLVKIKNGIAYFNITQLCEINSIHTEVTITGKGAGKGNCIYSIKDHHILNLTTELALNMTLIMSNGVEIQLTQKSKSNSITEIDQIKISSK